MLRSPRVAFQTVAPDAAPVAARAEGSPGHPLEPPRKQTAPAVAVEEMPASSKSSVPTQACQTLRGKKDPRPKADIRASGLYQDAFARQQRMKELKDHIIGLQEREFQAKLTQHDEGMRHRRKFFRGQQDPRSHLEREEDILRRRREKMLRLEEELRSREEAELSQCTFKPALVKRRVDRHARSLSQSSSRHGHHCMSQSSLPMTAGVSVVVSEPGSEVPQAGLQALVERQRADYDAAHACAREAEQLRIRLRQIHTELHNSFLREETQKVVTTLRDAQETTADSQELQEMERLIQERLDSGGEMLHVQKDIVSELVTRSQDKVRSRVAERFCKIRGDLEGELYTRQLTLVHDLEKIEAQVFMLQGGSLCEEARALGFEFGISAKVRAALRLAPSFVTGSGGLNQFQVDAEKVPAAAAPQQDGNEASERLSSIPTNQPSTAATSLVPGSDAHAEEQPSLHAKVPAIVGFPAAADAIAHYPAVRSPLGHSNSGPWIGVSGTPVSQLQGGRATLPFALGSVPGVHGGVYPRPYPAGPMPQVWQHPPSLPASAPQSPRGHVPMVLQVHAVPVGVSHHRVLSRQGIASVRPGLS